MRGQQKSVPALLRTMFRRDRSPKRSRSRKEELKYYDAESTLVGFNTPWAGCELDPETSIDLGSAAVATPLTLCAPTVGAALNQRVGRDIILKDVCVRGHVNIAAQSGLTTADAATYVRILLVLDTQTNSAQLNAEDVLNAASAANSTISSQPNPNFAERFVILDDIRMILSDPSLAGEVAANNVIQSGLARLFELHADLRGLTMRFNATGGGLITSVVDNSLHIIGACNDQALSPSISYYSRVRYIDP